MLQIKSKVQQIMFKHNYKKQKINKVTNLQYETLFIGSFALVCYSISFK